MMKPFDIAFDFLKSELIESLLDRMEGAELDLGKIGRDEELTNWKRFMHSNRRYIPEEERKFPSLRHVPEKRKEDEKIARQDKIRQDDYEAGLRMALERLEDSRLFRDKQGISTADYIERFKQSPEGKQLLQQLEDNLRNKRIAEITGLPSQTPPIKIANTAEDDFLLHALKTGDSSILDRFQARMRNPLVGDMSLQDFEEHYPTEMAVPQPGASVSQYPDWLQEMKDEHQRLNPPTHPSLEGLACPACSYKMPTNELSACPICGLDVTEWGR